MSAGPRWSVEGRGWPLAEHSRFVDVAGLRWHVQTMGQGPVLLLLHGTGAATHSWRDLAPRLARHFTVVAPDLPGHGFTSGMPRGGLTLPAMAGAVEGLLQAIEVRPALIIGHSAGAAIAVRAALDGVAAGGIVGLSSALRPFPGIAATLFPALARLLFVNPLAPHLFAAMARRPGETRRFLARSTGSRIDETGVACYARLFANAGHCAGAIRMMADWDLAPLAAALPTLLSPLLLIHGADDAAIPIGAARAVTAAARAELEVLPGLGHLAHEERPDLVAASIARFAAGLGLSSPVENVA